MRYSGIMLWVMSVVFIIVLATAMWQGSAWRWASAVLAGAGVVLWSINFRTDRWRG
jgi:hypothetical protein